MSQKISGNFDAALKDLLVEFLNFARILELKNRRK